MERKQQEWSKERIQAEMKDLKDSRDGWWTFAFIVGAMGVGAIVAPVGMIAFAPAGFFTPFIVVGIVLVLVGLLLFRKGYAKHRQYNDLKRKL